MSTNRTRYSFLSPMSVSDSASVLFAALDFFSVTGQAKVRATVAIPQTSSGILPLPAGHFMDYIKALKILAEPDRHMQNIRKLLNKMEEVGLLVPMGNSGSVFFPTNYYFLKELTEREKKGRFWLSECLGPEYVYKFFGNLIMHIVGLTSEGDEHGGTGVIISDKLLLTCKHVIDEMNINDTQNINGADFKVVDTHTHNEIDVGIIEFEPNSFSVNGNVCFDSPHLNDDVYVLGYPPIPYSKEAAPIMQKGEITNPKITTLDNHTVFLFSAIARPGNSGGPIIARNGRILGIVTKELSLQESNNFPFFAGIPTNVIVTALSDMGFGGILPVEDYQ